MASSLGQNLLRGKSKAENFGLFALYSSYFFLFLSAVWLSHGQPLAVIEQAVSLTQCQSLHLHYQFLARAGPGEVGSLHLTECPVSFDHNATTPQITENTRPRLKPSFSKMWKCPQYSKQVQLEIMVAFKLLKYFIGSKAKFRLQNFTFLLINQ